MKAVALILCIIAALLMLVFAVMFISHYISPPELSAPDGLDKYEQFFWEALIARLEPATYLAIGLIGVASALVGVHGGLLGFYEKRLPLARGLVIAAAGFGFFILLLPVAFLYLAAAVSMLRQPEKAAGDLTTLTLGFILVTFMFQWITDPLFKETFLSRLSFGDMILLTAKALTEIVLVISALSGAVLSGVCCIILYKRRQIVLATALAITAASFILMFTPVSSAAAFLPFVLFIFGLIALAFELRKRHGTEQKVF